MNKSKLNWKLWIGIAISALFLFLAVRKIKLDELSIAFNNAKYIYLIPSILLFLLSLYLRAFRWRFFFEPIKKIRVNSLFSATIIGFMANNLLPARLGEFVRAYAIGEKEHINKSICFATIVLERIFDGLTLLFFLAIIVLCWKSPFPDWLGKAAIAALAVYFSVLIFLILLKKETEKAIRFVMVATTFLPEKFRIRLIGMLESFIEGLEILKNNKNIVIISCLSFIVLSFPAISIYLLFISFNFSLPLTSAFLLLVILSIGVMVPSAPGYIGTIQFLCVVGLALFDISKTQALSFSILYHASQYVPVTIMGLIYFFVEGYNFTKVQKAFENN